MSFLYEFKKGNTDSIRDNVNAGRKIGVILGTLQALVINPVTWVFTVITVFALYLSSIVAVLGNNNACVNATNNSSSVGEYLHNQDDRINQAATFFMSTEWGFLGGKQMNKQQAAAIIGNAKIESGVDTFRMEAMFRGEEKQQYKTNESIHEWAKQRQSGAFCNTNIYKGKLKVKACNGLGLFQWTHYPGRTKKLLDYATQSGKQWWQPETQFEFIKQELENHYGKILVSKGFDKETNLDNLTQIFLKTYLGVNIKLKERQKAAEEIIGKIQNTTSQSFSSSTCSTQTQGNGEVADFAIKIAHKFGETPGCRNTSYKPLMDAAELAYKNTGKGIKGVQTLCDCGKFISVVLRGSGFDPAFPQAGTLVQEPYMLKNKHKYKEYSNFDEKQPGDIYITNNGSHPADGHIEMYVGKVDGKDTIAVASWNQYDAKLVQMDRVKRKSNSPKGCAVDVYGGRVYKCFHLVK